MYRKVNVTFQQNMVERGLKFLASCPSKLPPSLLGDSLPIVTVGCFAIYVTPCLQKHTHGYIIRALGFPWAGRIIV
jgi:hypothetical protein